MLYKVVSMQEKCANHPSARNTYVAALSLSPSLSTLNRRRQCRKIGTSGAERWHNSKQEHLYIRLRQGCQKCRQCRKVSQSSCSEQINPSRLLLLELLSSLLQVPPCQNNLHVLWHRHSHRKPSTAQHLGSQRPLLSYFTPVHVPRPEGITCVLLTFSKPSRLRPVSRVLLCGR